MNIAEFTNSGCFTIEFMNSTNWPIEPHRAHVRSGLLPEDWLTLAKISLG
jgi:hypothetical protein